MIKIETHGSFCGEWFTTSAEYGGHAQAVRRAIKFLPAIMPAAIRSDAKLTAAGEYPSKSPFGTDGDEVTKR